MGWCTSHDLDKFNSAAGMFLRARPAENMPLLSAAGDLADGPGVPSDALFGWLEQGGGVRGAFVHVPPGVVLAGGVAPEAAAALADVLARTKRSLGGIDASAGAAEAFATTWKQRTKQGARVYRHTRVYKLAGPGLGLPSAAGRPRPATTADKDLVTGWLTAFRHEVGDVIDAASAADLLSHDQVLLWETLDDGPVAIAVLTRPVAGVVRIELVYTPPSLRHQGYASAMLVAACRAAHDAGATQAVLITDVSSPLSGNLRERLGCESAGDRLVLSFR